MVLLPKPIKAMVQTKRFWREFWDLSLGMNGLGNLSAWLKPWGYAFQPITGPTEEGWENIHPNTVRFLITTRDGEKFDIVGCSIGGGKVRIVGLNGISVHFTGESPILVTRHLDNPGIIAGIASLLYQERINIGNMRVSRERHSDTANMYLEIDSDVPENIVEKIQQIPGMLSVILLQREEK